MTSTHPRAAQPDAVQQWSAAWRTPFAVLGVAAGARVTQVAYLDPGHAEIAPRTALAERTVRQIERYVDDPDFRFSLPLAPAGTPFRQTVWTEIARIPVGESRTYGELARAVHSAARAIGGACGANPIALIIPCHRVVGSRGHLGGFMNRASGDPIAIKRWLLVHEGYRFGRT